MGFGPPASLRFGEPVCYNLSMKFGIDCRDLVAGSLNGIGRFVANLIRSLADRNDSPDLFLYGNQDTVFEIADPPDTPLEAERRRANERSVLWWDRVTLSRLVRRDRLDVFLSPYFKAPGIRSCPIAVTVHDLMALRLPQSLSGRGRASVEAFRAYAAHSARRAAVVLTVSEHSRRDIAELLDVPVSKVCVVGNCVDARFRPPDAPETIRRAKEVCGISGDYLLYVGNFRPHKNIDGLLDAYAGLDVELRDRFSLVLAGREDPWTAEARRRADRLGLDDRVRFPGHVPDEHLPGLYAGAHAFVTLSRWEGFGLPPLEAMACGAPVVVSDRAALPEVTGEAALRVDPEDQAAVTGTITRVLTEPATCRELSEKGRHRAAEFSPDRFAEKVLAALAKAMEKRTTDDR